MFAGCSLSLHIPSRVQVNALLSPAPQSHTGHIPQHTLTHQLVLPQAGTQLSRCSTKRDNFIHLIPFATMNRMRHYNIDEIRFGPLCPTTPAKKHSSRFPHIEETPYDPFQGASYGFGCEINLHNTTPSDLEKVGC